MKVSNNLVANYNDYYIDENVLKKRKIAARQSLDHIIKMIPADADFNSLLDVGAGDGSVLSEIDKTAIFKELAAVEISESGLESIKSKNIASLKSVTQFNGYKINADDKSYDLAISVHVLEHVEHERYFLEELGRVANYVYIEVPLELTLNVNRSIKCSGKYGHINFYNKHTFQNLLRTSGLEIKDFQVFANSKEYEIFLSGKIIGTIKYLIRQCMLKLLPFSGLMMTYMAGALCKKIDD